MWHHRRMPGIPCPLLVPHEIHVSKPWQGQGTAPVGRRWHQQHTPDAATHPLENGRDYQPRHQRSPTEPEREPFLTRHFDGLFRERRVHQVVARLLVPGNLCVRPIKTVRLAHYFPLSSLSLSRDSLYIKLNPLPLCFAGSRNVHEAGTEAKGRRVAFLPCVASVAADIPEPASPPML